jgi:hypothetical protein
MTMTSVEFSFRVWVHPEDPADVEVWFQGLETASRESRFVSDWLYESFHDEDFYDLFDLDKTKCWQVVGKAVLRGSYDYYSEYNEDLTIIEFEKAEVPEDEIP